MLVLFGAVSLSLVLFRFSSEFQVSTYLVMQFGDFSNVCPIHIQRLFLISSTESWFALSHSELLLTVSGQQTFSNLRRNICTILMMVAVLQFSASYQTTVLTSALKMLTLILVDSCFELRILFICKNAAISMPILTLTSLHQILIVVQVRESSSIPEFRH